MGAGSSLPAGGAEQRRRFWGGARYRPQPAAICGDLHAARWRSAHVCFCSATARPIGTARGGCKATPTRSSTPTGLAQAEALAERLRAHQLDAVVSSDLTRALTTGRIIAETLGVPLMTDHGLRETNVGAAEGLLWEDAKARFGAELTERWYSGDTAFPGGETGRATLTRGLAALRRFATAHAYRRIGVSTHGAIFRQLVKHALPPGALRSEPATPCCSFSNTSRRPTASRWWRPTDGELQYGRSPLIWVRCISRRVLGSNSSRRCMTQRLSHRIKSPTRHC